MFKNYIKIALRNLKRQKGYSFINIAGLAIGMATCFLILLYIQDEFSYDRYHLNSKRIYRILREDVGNNNVEAITAYRLAQTLQNDFPEISKVVRVCEQMPMVGFEQKRFQENHFFYADANIFNVFTLPLIKGNSTTALKEPSSVVVAEDIARKYFGEEEPIGKQLTVENEKRLTVTGVMKSIPHNSHLKFDFLASMSDFAENLSQDDLESWWSRRFYTYLLLPKAYSAADLEEKLPAFVQRDIRSSNLKYQLQPLTDIWLHSTHIKFDIESKGDITYIYIFSAIALFILLIACINYMNLSTARSAIRVKEVGMRKVIGAHRWQLIKQFLGESISFSCIALLLAITMAEFFLPVFNALSGKVLTIDLSENSLFLLGAVGMVLFVGIVSGSYPALFLSAFHPITVLKGTTGSGSKSTVMRKGLIICQFVISIALIIGLSIIYSQLDYISTKKLGFEKEYVLNINFPDEMRPHYEFLKTELLQNPNIVKVSASQHVPPNRLGWISKVQPEGAHEEQTCWMHTMAVHFDFIETLGFEIVSGRSFSKEYPTDSTEAFMLNETAVKEMGLESPIGKRIRFWDRPGTVIGVVKDFHYWSLHEKIGPVIMMLDQKWFWRFLVRIRSENIMNTMNFLEKKWQQFTPNWVFDYHFIDDEIDNLYRSEKRLGNVIAYLTFLAIFIACLGLFGLVSFTAERRTKEIGIRKVLGATILGIVYMLSKDFTKWVLIANLIAWPLAYYAMNKWLQNFAYRIDIQWWIFVLAGGIALIIALLTVSWQAIRAAIANPIESLRYE